MGSSYEGEKARDRLSLFRDGEDRELVKGPQHQTSVSALVGRPVALEDSERVVQAVLVEPGR